MNYLAIDHALTFLTKPARRLSIRDIDRDHDNPVTDESGERYPKNPPSFSVDG